MNDKIKIEVPADAEILINGEPYKVAEPVRKLPESWGDYLSTCDYDQTLTLTRNKLSLRQASLAYEALYKLQALRDYYRDGWLPTSNNNSTDCHLINFDEDGEAEILLCTSWEAGFLKFNSLDQAEHFLEHHGELIEQAKDLLGG